MESLLLPPKMVEIEKPEAGDLFFTYWGDDYNDGWFPDSSRLRGFTHIGVFLAEDIVIHKLGHMEVRIETFEDCIDYCNYWHAGADRISYHRVVD
jgi:hypothetical protein